MASTQLPQRSNIPVAIRGPEPRAFIAIVAVRCREMPDPQRWIVRKGVSPSSSAPDFVIKDFRCDAGEYKKMIEIREEIELQNLRWDRVISLRFCLEKMSEQQVLLKFRFKKARIRRLAMAIPYAVDEEGFARTGRRRYRVHQVEATCILLRRLATPCRWADLTVEFGRHPSNLSEVFYYALDLFFDKFQVLTKNWPTDFVRSRAQLYANAISRKGAVLSRTVAFIDGTSLTIARPSGLGQRATYSGQKRKNCLKFQAIAAPDGILLNLFGPMEGRSHEMTLYRASEIDHLLSNSLFVQGQQYYVYGDSAYTLRPYLQVAFRGTELSLNQAQV
jgi:DDE superfamily endonuclease